MLRFVLAGPKGTGKSSIFSRLSPQASGSTKSGVSQTVPIPPSLFSVVTLDFPSPTFSALTQRESIPQVLANAHAIIYCMKDSKDDNLRQLQSLLQSCDLSPRLFVLLHQIDRINSENQASYIAESIETAGEIGVPPEKCFATSLFDGSLTQSFSKIVADLIPNYNNLQKCVTNLSKSLRGSRVVILDASTFLPICDSSPDKSEQQQPIFDFFLKIYPKKNSMKTLKFECNSSVLVYTVLSKTAGVFVSSVENSVTTDAILFNVERATPMLKELINLKL